MSVPSITEAEWLLMRELWREAPRTAADLTASLEASTAWSGQTVKTLLARLVRKGAVAYDRGGREFHYRPAVEEERVVRAETSSFMERVFGGSVVPMVASFLEETPLSEEDIAALRKTLDAQETPDPVRRKGRGRRKR